MVCDGDGIEEIAILPLADAVTSPAAAEYPIDVVVVPGFHGGLRGRVRVQEMIVAWLGGEDLRGAPLWVTLERVIAGSAAAWRMPPLGRYDAALTAGE